MELKLERQRYTNQSIIGSIYHDNEFICYTMERPWKSNEPFESCVPVGTYHLEPHNSDRHQRTFALVGDTVSHFKSNKQRYAILFHPANYPFELNGCIACGILAERDQMVGSREAHLKLMKVIRDNGVKDLLII
jgi:hypothetical protein